MSEENKKEKKYFGFLDLTEHTTKWMKVFTFALIFLIISISGGRIYEMVVKNGCGEAGCSNSATEEITVIKKETGKDMINTGQEIIIKELTYKLYKLKTANEYALVGWMALETKGDTIRDVVQGVEEKEMISTGKENEYVFVWGELEENLKIMENGKEVEEYKKEQNEAKLITITTKYKENITFK
jgi:hypothetical protein